MLHVFSADQKLFHQHRALEQHVDPPPNWQRQKCTLPPREGDGAHVKPLQAILVTLTGQQIIHPSISYTLSYT